MPDPEPGCEKCGAGLRHETAGLCQYGAPKALVEKLRKVNNITTVPHMRKWLEMAQGSIVFRREMKSKSPRIHGMDHYHIGGMLACVEAHEAAIAKATNEGDPDA
jgi:hypothetical protein